MRKSRFTEEQIIKVLKEHAAGLSTGDLCRKHGISAATQFARTQAREMAAAGKIAARRHDQEHAVFGSRRRSARRKTDGVFFRRSGPGSAAGVTQINRATTDSVTSALSVVRSMRFATFIQNWRRSRGPTVTFNPIIAARARPRLTRAMVAAWADFKKSPISTSDLPVIAKAWSHRGPDRRKPFKSYPALSRSAICSTISRRALPPRAFKRSASSIFLLKPAQSALLR